MEQRFEVPLHLILDNPYQPRTTDNAEHIKSLALSIAADGLLQVPTARELNDGSYELAFGHSRRKAFEWLNLNWETEGLPNRYEGYWKMPINVEALSDEDMYRQAVSENVQRKDLDPIELSKSMTVQEPKRRAHCSFCGGKGDSLKAEVVKTAIGTRYRIPESHASCKKSALSLSLSMSRPRKKRSKNDQR